MACESAVKDRRSLWGLGTHVKVLNCRTTDRPQASFKAMI